MELSAGFVQIIDDLVLCTAQPTVSKENKSIKSPTEFCNPEQFNRFLETHCLDKLTNVRLVLRLDLWKQQKVQWRVVYTVQMRILYFHLMVELYVLDTACESTPRAIKRAPTAARKTVWNLIMWPFSVMFLAVLASEVCEVCRSFSADFSKIKNAFKKYVTLSSRQQCTDHSN